MKKEKLYKTFSKIPTLRTERLILRPLHITDAYDMYEYASREDVTKYLLWSPHTSVDYTRNYLAYVESRYAACEFFDWAVVIADTGKMIGTAGFTKIDCPHNKAEIGYVLNPEYHGMGIATEAARKLLEFGFDELGLHRIEARFMKDNEASLAVMKKLGMTFEGFQRDALLVKGRYRTVGYCGVLESEYRR